MGAIDALLDDLIRQIREQEAREAAAIAAFQAATNQHTAAQINAVLAAGRPARVRVIGVRPYFDSLTGCTRSFPSCDHGRTGRVTAPVDADGQHVRVEQLTPGDDGCPSRYHKAGNLALIADDVPDASPQAMRVEAIAFWSTRDDLDAADATDAVIAELGHDVAVEPDDTYGTVFLMREHNRPNYRLRPNAVAAVLTRLAAKEGDQP